MGGSGNDNSFGGCTRCGATSWKGKRLALARCDKCNTAFCKVCADQSFIGRVQQCPSCGSDDYTQYGFVG